MPPRKPSKPFPPPPLHELESEVMEEIWRREQASVRQVMDALNRSAPRPRAYTTYMTILSRLHGKGLLQRQRQGKADIYAPDLSREDYLELRAGTEVDALVDKFGDVALAHFARQVERLDAGRLGQLRALARSERDGPARRS